MMMEHQLFGKPPLSHQAVHEDLEMILLLTCTSEPEKVEVHIYLK